MAIMIEQEKRKINWFALATVLLIVVLVGAAIYYLFFASTPFAERIAPPRLQTIKELSSIKLEPETIINNPYFQILRQYVNPVSVETGLVGKTNPFLK